MTREPDAWDPDSRATVHEVTLAGRSGAGSRSGRAVRIDAAALRELEIFMAWLRPGEHGTVTRPALAWKDGARIVVDVTLERGTDGTWTVALGDERPTDAAPDVAQPVDVRLDDLATMVWATDHERMARWFNAAWLEFVGADLASELGWGWMRHVHPDDMQGLLEAYEAAQSEVRGFEHTARVQDAAGRYRRLCVRAAPRLDGGALSGFVGLCKADERDATEQRGLVDLLPLEHLTDDSVANTIERLEMLESALEISRPAETVEAALLRRIVAAWTEQHGSLRPRHDDIVLSVHEAVTNCIRHAYEGRPGPVRLACNLGDHDVVFRVRDWGGWHVPQTDRIHRGITLMNALADDVRIDRRTDGTEVTLWFVVGASA